MAVADTTFDCAAYLQHKESAEDQGLSIAHEESEEKEEKIAIKVTLPTIFAMHVQDMLKRRGVIIDELILELLTRYVPSIIANSAESPSNSGSKEASNETETIA